MNIEKSYEMPFPVEVIYAAWTSSDTVIPPATSMDINAVVGGHYKLIIEGPDSLTTNNGEFIRNNISGCASDPKEDFSIT